MAQDVTVLYQGGSGGFLLSYYLLLSGQYQTGLNYDSVEQLISTQFPNSLAQDPSVWKQTEHWPDNKFCKLNKAGSKLYLICNPTWQGMEEENLSISKGTQQYFLYTNIHTQLRMSYEKRAYWFTPVSKKHFNITSDEKTYIKEILKSADNNQDPEIRHIIERFNPTYQVSLQEFIKTKTLPGQPAPNLNQIQFVDYWLSLQPTKVKRLLHA